MEQFFRSDFMNDLFKSKLPPNKHLKKKMYLELFFNLLLSEILQ